MRGAKKMKITDDYDAKLKIWAREGKVHRLPKVHGLPPFSPKKFSSYAEMNEWKKEYLAQIAAQGGVTWTT